MSDLNSGYSVICFGEILWSARRQHSGGSSLNMAYHLKKLGMNPALITRIGQDDPGKRLVNQVDSYGIATDFFQMDFELETGKMNIGFREKEEPFYDFPYPAAWDNIRWDKDFETVLANTPYLVFGNLIARSYHSRETLFRLSHLAKFRVFDIDFRLSPFDRPVIEKLLQGAYLLKLNLEDLQLVTGWFAHYRDEEERIKLIQERFNISNIFVMNGVKGVIWRTEDSFYKYPFPATLGTMNEKANAFLPGIISKLIDRSPPEEVLDFASSLNAFMASCREPYPDYSITSENRIQYFSEDRQP